MLILCLCPAAMAQKANRYLEKPLPQGWGKDVSHAIPGDDNLFSRQIPPIDDKWWKAFDDPMLDSLITVASTQNYSVLSAMARMDMAKSNLRIERGSFFPSISLDGGWARQQSSGNVNALPQSITGAYSASLNASWELDVFGSIRQRVKAQRETFMASKEEYTSVMVSLCAQIASAYIGLRELQQELSVVTHNCHTQAAVLNITEVRYKTGLVSKLDVSQAKSVYYSTKASLTMLEAGIIQYTNALAVLMGLYPQDVKGLIDHPRPLPDYIETVGVGFPANLLLRRPDIRSAERQVNAQAATLGASKSDWWPQVFVKGSIGFASHDIDKIANHNSLTYEIAPAISWNFFQGGKLAQATRLAKAQLDETIRQFNETVLTSVQEVDNAMSSYKNSIKQIVALREVVNQGQQTLDLSLDLYKQGLTPFQNVLDAQRSLLSYENQLTQAKGQSLVYLIQLYQALGGGWDEDGY